MGPEIQRRDVVDLDTNMFHPMENLKSEFSVRAHDPGFCAGGDCPKVYERIGEDAYYVRGETVGLDVVKALAVPSGESVVRIPKSLISQLKDDLLRG